MHKVEFFTRKGCCLCDQALEIITSTRGDLAFELVEQDIEATPELERKYFERIPVVKIDGQEEFEYFVDEKRFRELIGA